MIKEETKEDIDRSLEGYGMCVCGHPSYAHNGRWNKGSCRVPDCQCNHPTHHFTPRKKAKKK